MKLLKSFLIFAFVCCIHARKVEYESHIKSISDLNNINFEDLVKDANFQITIDENDPSISQSIDIYGQVTDEIEGMNDDSEILHDRFNEMREQSAGWSGRLKDTLNGIYETVFTTVANVIDSSTNKAKDKFDQGISAALNFTDRVHTQNKLLIAKVQKCAEQQGISGETISEDAYAKIERCVPDAINSINETAQVIIGNLKEIRSFLTEDIPMSVEGCLINVRKSSSPAITTSAKAIFCLGGVSARLCVESAQMSMKMTTCGVKCSVRFEEIKMNLQKCYMEGFYAISKEAAEKGIDLSKCVVGGEKNNKVE